MTREEWLTDAMNRIIKDVFEPHELRMPPILKISCAPLPCKPSVPGTKVLGTYGVCCYPECADDGAVHIFINTVLGNNDVMDILSTICHEVVHAHCHAEGFQCKHGGLFKKVVYQVGLSGKPAQAKADQGTELWSTLEGIAMALGPYPHAPLRPKAKKARQVETLTWVSETDPEYVVKAKFTQTYEKGVPKDHNGQPMKPKDAEKFAELEEWYLNKAEQEEAEAAE